MLDRNGEWLRAFIAPDDSWRIHEPSLDQISPKLRTAVLTYEDRWFYHHFGINPLSIVQAAIGTFVLLPVAIETMYDPTKASVSILFDDRVI